MVKAKLLKELRKQIASAEKTGLPAAPDFQPLSTSSKAPTVRLLNRPFRGPSKKSVAPSCVHEYILALDLGNFSEATECDATAKDEKGGCHSLLASISLRIQHLPNHGPSGTNANSGSLLSPEQLSSCLQLFEDNMGALYRNSSWGLDMDKKRDELVHRKARFILVTTTKNSIAGNDQNSSSIGNTAMMSSTNPVSEASTDSNVSPDHVAVGEDVEKMVAFVHYRYEMDDDELPECLVLYLYEIQVAEEFRGYGLGTVLMNLVEQMATQQPSVEKIVLTALKANAGAMKFYTRTLGYVVDESSPGYHNQVADYEILSKRLKRNN
jgi:N-alpha-acetyltransferase 40